MNDALSSLRQGRQLQRILQSLLNTQAGELFDGGMQLVTVGGVIVKIDGYIRGIHRKIVSGGLCRQLAEIFARHHQAQVLFPQLQRDRLEFIHTPVNYGRPTGE